MLWIQRRNGRGIAGWKRATRFGVTSGVAGDIPRVQNFIKIQFVDTISPQTIPLGDNPKQPHETRLGVSDSGLG